MDLCDPVGFQTVLLGVFSLEKKHFKFTLKNDGPPGSVSAVFSTFNAMDLDGDITLPGAFGEQNVRMAQWGHNWSAPAAGKGKTREDGDDAIFDGQFFVNTSHGNDLYETVKGLGDLQEWSYGFEPVKYALRDPKEGESPLRWDGKIRELVEMRVIEVSPVMLGAGVDTRTLEIRGLQDNALPLLGKVRSGELLSDDEIETLAKVFDVPVLEMNRVLALKSEAVAVVDPAVEDVVDPESEPLVNEPSKDLESAFMELQRFLAFGPED